MSAAEILRRHWNDSGERLDRRLDGLTDREYFWSPVPSCWTVRPHVSLPDRWDIDYDWPTPEPPPFTTIAWRLVHLANGNWIYWEHAFGPGERMFPDLVVPGTADGAVTYWRDSRAPITSWLDAATDEELPQLRPSHLGAPRSAGDVVLILLDEQVHHGAEVGVMRDLYRALASG